MARKKKDETVINEPIVIQGNHSTAPKIQMGQLSLK